MAEVLRDSDDGDRSKLIVSRRSRLNLLPSALPSKYCLAKARLTMATGGEAIVSSVVNARPERWMCRQRGSNRRDTDGGCILPRSHRRRRHGRTKGDGSSDPAN